jgi:plasmid stabilization system protein ParE
MSKLLERAIAKVRELPEEEQDAIAIALFSMADADASAFPIDDEARAAILEGLAQAERGEFVPDEVPSLTGNRSSTIWKRRARPRRGEMQTFIDAQIDTLATLPERHPVVKELGVRVLWVGRYPYLVYYQIRQNEVAILHIRHAARRPWAGGE